MTEPTRDFGVTFKCEAKPEHVHNHPVFDLHAETLRWLSLYHDTLVESEETCSAYAAACVRRVAELEAEVERLRAKAAIVDAMERGEVWDLVVLELPSLDAPRRQYRITGKRGRFVGDTLAAAYAAATREGTDA